ncbi:MAG: hypothetical protein ABIL09_29945, partial [Gemmatimonadota bacterium]
MFGGPGRRPPARTRIPALERAISWVVLGALGLIGVLVYRAGQDYDPALFALDPARLAAGPVARAPDLAGAPL